TELTRARGVHLTERRRRLEKTSELLQRERELGARRAHVVFPPRQPRSAAAKRALELGEFGIRVRRSDRADELHVLSRESEGPIRRLDPRSVRGPVLAVKLAHSKLAAISASSLRSPFESRICPASFSRLKRSATIVSPFDALSTYGLS